MLLVEDDEFNREIAIFMLQECGFVVDVAMDGIEAVSMVSEKQYALILMDLQMPRMNGIEATQAIRKIKAYKSTPIIALTANAFAEDREMCFQAGMSDFLSKPISAQLLQMTLLDQLQRNV